LIEPYWRAWLDRHGAGRFAVIRGSSAAVSFYCAKYATKRGEFFFSENLGQFRGEGAPAVRVSLFPELVPS
jgi:hypothetical protein